jgi:hypothetical protein
LKLLVISHLLPGDAEPGASRVTWLAGAMAPFGVETRLLALRRRGTPRSEGAPEPDTSSATVVECASRELPRLASAFFQRNGGYARTVIGRPSHAEAVSLGLDIVRSFRPDAIVSSIPPRRVGEAAYRIARETELPWVIDWQDPIAARPLNVWPSRGYYSAYAEREALWVERAALHVVTAPSHERLLAGRMAAGGGARVATVPIGLPAGDAKARSRERAAAPERGRLLYSGSLTPDLYGFARRFPWKLSMRMRSRLTFGRLCHAPFAGEVDYRPLGIRALGAIARLRTSVTALEFAGARGAGVATAHVRRLGLGRVARFLPWAGPARAAEALSRAHVLWLCCAGTSARGGEPVLLSKAAGYLASGRPVFAVVPQESDTAELLRGHAGVFMADPARRVALDDCLARALDTAPDARFDRDIGHLRSEALAERMAALIADAACGTGLNETEGARRGA